MEMVQIISLTNLLIVVLLKKTINQFFVFYSDFHLFIIKHPINFYVQFILIY